MKKILAGIAGVIIISTPVFATEWVIVPGAKTDGDMFCLDRDNVSREKGIISAWFKQFKEGNSFTKTFIEFDCSQEKLRVVKSIDYDNVKDLTTTVDLEPKWELGSPESPFKAAAAMICKKGKGNRALVSLKEKR